MTEMTTDKHRGFDPSELCSRKLWDMIRERKEGDGSPEALQAALKELAERRHYLNQLEDLGVFDSRRH